MRRELLLLDAQGTGASSSSMLGVSDGGSGFLSQMRSTWVPSYSVTVNVLPAPRPHTSGKYICEAVGGRVRYAPGRLARIW